MSAEQWKAGDVAFYDDRRVFLVVDATGKREWIDQDGDRRSIPLDAVDRALVVIDPQDKAATLRLAEAVLARTSGPTSNRTPGLADQLAAGLAEYVDPTPLLDEPTGLYAVVEDARAVEWVRAELVGATQWFSIGAGEWRSWDDIRAVRVLSGGVQGAGR